MRSMKKRGPNVLFDLKDLLFFLTQGQQYCCFIAITSVRDSLTAVAFLVSMVTITYNIHIHKDRL